MAKRTILYLDEIGRIDGAEVVLLNLVANLDRKRFEPIVVCGSDGELVDRLRALNIRVEVLKMKEAFKVFWNVGGRKIFNPFGAAAETLYSFFFALKFFFYLRRISPDIVHTNTLLANLYGTIPAKLSGRRLVWHEHNIQPPGIRRKIVNILGNSFPDRIIAISNAVRSIYTSVADRSKLCTVYNGLDLEKFRKPKRSGAIRKEFKIAPDAPLVAITAVLRPWKGQEYFVLAAKEVLKTNPDARFLVVGDEVFSRDRGYKDYLKSVAAKADIQKEVVFTGFRNDIPEILSEIDILVSATVLPEPFSLIVLEAMASGLPVVATRTGGVPEVMADGVTGILVEPKDPKAIAGAVTHLLDNRDIAEKMGTEGRKRAQELFSIKRFVRDVEKIYNDVLK